MQTYIIKQNKVFILFLLILFSAFAAFSQTGEKHLRGTVKDANGAVIVGARITVVAKGGTIETTSVSDQNGEFSMRLASDEYTIKVAAEGFAENSTVINLEKIESKSLEIVLEIAGSTVTVTIVASDYRTDAVASATKTLTPLRDIPQSIGVVTKSQMNDQSMSGIGDVVRYLPGIMTHQGENNRDQVIIRGQSSSADFFINGVRDDVQYYRDVYNLEQLEALKGPNAMIFGRGGGGGVINRITKEASFLPFSEFTAQLGSFNDRRFTADFNRPVNDIFAFRVNGLYEKSDSFRRFVGFERYGFSPTLSITPDEKTKITLAYEFFRDKRVADRGITSFQGAPADVPISTFYGDSDNSRVRANVNLFSGTIERQFGKLNIRNRTLFGDYDRFYQNYVPGATNAAMTWVTLTAYNNATKRRNLFNQTDLTYTLSTGNFRHTLLGGFELGRQQTNNFRNTGFFNNTTTSIQVPFEDPVTNTPITFRQSATDADNRLKLNLAAAYLQDQIEFSRYFQVVVGVRFDHFDLRFHNNRNGDDLRRIDNLVSPRFGVVVKPIEQLSFYGNYSVSFLPSSGDQFSSLTNVTQQVKPEKFTNYEVGVKWDIRQNLSFTSAFYRLDRTNTRATDPNNPAAIIQTGSQRTNGFELGLNGNVTREWSVAGGYAFQDAFITSATTAAVAGKQVAQVPRHNFSVWNKYQFLPQFGAGLGIIYRSDVFAAVDNTVKLPGYVRADAAFYYSFSERWRLQANIENLFDKKYYLNADSNTNITPGAPRAFKIGLSARF